MPPKTLHRSVFELYIPAWGGNRARYQAGQDPEPLTVQLRLPTWREQRAYLRGSDHQEAFEAFLAEHIGEITHLVLEDGRPVPNGRTLLALADEVDGELLQELNVALGGRLNLEPGLKKNCSPAPGSAASPSASAGTAPTAGAEVSTS